MESSAKKGGVSHFPPPLLPLGSVTPHSGTWSPALCCICNGKGVGLNGLSCSSHFSPRFPIYFIVHLGISPLTSCTWPGQRDRHYAAPPPHYTGSQHLRSSLSLSALSFSTLRMEMCCLCSSPSQQNPHSLHNNPCS